VKITVDGTTMEAFAKRAMFLAWQACGGPLGMGVFQDHPGADEDAVWANIMRAGDCPGGTNLEGFRRSGEAYADYVFGRMMKFSLSFKDDGLETRDGDWRPDYQAFCHKYPDPTALFNATAESLGCSWAEQKDENPPNQN